MAKFKDRRGRDWTVRITGATIEEAAALGIDLSSDFVVALMRALQNTMSGGDEIDEDATPSQKATAKAAQDAENLRAMTELGAKVLNFKVIGTMVSLCWLGCKHCARAQAEKVSEREFKEGLIGKVLLDAAMATFNALCECFGLEMEMRGAADPTTPAGAGDKPTPGSGG